MRNLRIFIFIPLIVSFFCLINCSKEKDAEIIPVSLVNLDTITFNHSMKGWELYSWPNGNDWNYAILPGTNRVKSYEEVTSNLIVYGKDSLKMLLDRLPENENIFWIGKGWLERCWANSYENLSLPDNKIISEIKDYCIQKNLSLLVSD